MLRLIFCLVMMALLTACGDALPEYTKLDKLRVLALKVSAPEVAPGTLVTVTPVVSDLPYGASALTYTAEGCVDPGIGYGASPSCASALDRLSIGSGSVTLTAPYYSEALAPINVTVPASIFSGKTSAEQLAGISYLFVYRITDASGASVTAFKRIIASTQVSPNSNPVLSNILANGVAITTLPGVETALVPSFAGGDNSRYTSTWFYSEGSFKYLRTTGLSENTYTPPSQAPSGRSVFLVVVTHDDRGGVAYKIITQ